MYKQESEGNVRRYQEMFQDISGDVVRCCEMSGVFRRCKAMPRVVRRFLDRIKLVRICQ